MANQMKMMKNGVAAAIILAFASSCGVINDFTVEVKRSTNILKQVNDAAEPNIGNIVANFQGASPAPEQDDYYGDTSLHGKADLEEGEKTPPNFNGLPVPEFIATTLVSPEQRATAAGKESEVLTVKFKNVFPEPIQVEDVTLSLYGSSDGGKYVSEFTVQNSFDTLGIGDFKATHYPQFDHTDYRVEFKGLHYMIQPNQSTTWYFKANTSRIPAGTQVGVQLLNMQYSVVGTKTVKNAVLNGIATLNTIQTYHKTTTPTF